MVPTSTGKFWLEGDRLEAAHFQEYNGETISDQAFFLRFEKQD